MRFSVSTFIFRCCRTASAFQILDLQPANRSKHTEQTHTHSKKALHEVNMRNLQALVYKLAETNKKKFRNLSIGDQIPVKSTHKFALLLQ